MFVIVVVEDEQESTPPDVIISEPLQIFVTMLDEVEIDEDDDALGETEEKVGASQ